MSAQQFIERAEEHRNLIAYLRAIAPDYPGIFTRSESNRTDYTTMAQFIYKNIVYRRHVVETSYYQGTESIQEIDAIIASTKARLHKVVTDTMRYAVPWAGDEVVVNKENNIVKAADLKKGEHKG